MLATYESRRVFTFDMSSSREIGEGWLRNTGCVLTVDINGISIDIVSLETLKTSSPMPLHTRICRVEIHVVFHARRILQPFTATRGPFSFQRSDSEDNNIRVLSYFIR